MKSETSYDQPVKAEVRKRILSHAVETLTLQRDSARVVRADELRETVELANRNLDKMKFAVDAAKVNEELENWIAYSESSVGKKTASELKVLYLTGPKPLNDLDVLTSLGVNPHNVWAVTSSKDDAESAAQQIADSDSCLKIHHGPITDFFRAHTDSFDIVYLDCCGPFAFGSPNTLTPVFELLSQGRLAPLSVLITNFSQASEQHHDSYNDILTSHFRYRYRSARPEMHEQVDFEESKYDPETLWRYVDASWQDGSLPYSEFVTQLIADLAMVLIPQCRAFSLRAFFDRYLSDNRARKATVAKATFQPGDDVPFEQWLDQVGDAVVAPGNYPLRSFINTLKKIDGDKLANQILGSRVNGKNISQLIEVATFADGVF
jgi:hypothetical protein